MADSRNLENRKNCDISITVWPITAKFGTMMHFYLSTLPAIKITKFWKS